LSTFYAMGFEEFQGPTVFKTLNMGKTSITFKEDGNYPCDEDYK